MYLQHIQIQTRQTRQTKQTQMLSPIPAPRPGLQPYRLFSTASNDQHSMFLNELKSTLNRIKHDEQCRQQKYQEQQQHKLSTIHMYNMHMYRIHQEYVYKVQQAHYHHMTKFASQK